MTPSLRNRQKLVGPDVLETRYERWHARWQVMVSEEGMCDAMAPLPRRGKVRGSGQS